MQDPWEVAGRLDPGGQGGKLVGQATRTGSQCVGPLQGGVVSAHGHSDQRGGLDPTRGSHPVDPTAAPRGGSTRSTRLTRSAGAHGRQGSRRTRCGHVSRGSLRGFAGSSQRAQGGVLRSTRPIPVDGRLEFGLRPWVPEPVNSPLPEIAPTAGRDSAIGPRADSELSKDEVSLTRDFSGLYLGYPSPMLAIEIRGRKVSVIQIGPEFRDIVGGSFKDLRANTYGHEAGRLQVAMPDDPPAPGFRVPLA